MICVDFQWNWISHINGLDVHLCTVDFREVKGIEIFALY